MPAINRKLVDLQPPIAGMDRRWSYQKQPPYTTPDCLNIRCRDTMKGRVRVASRPGIIKHSYDLLGSGVPVRMLNTVDVVKTDGFNFWSDSFKDGLSAEWAVASWVGTLPETTDDFASIDYNTPVGAVRSALTFDESQSYEICMTIVPYAGAFHGKYQIFARMDNTTPVATTEGIIVELVMTGTTGAYTGSIKSYVGGSLTTYTLTPGTVTPRPGLFKVLVTGDTVKVYWHGTQLISQAVSGSQNGRRFGFGMECTVSGGLCLVENYLIQYYYGSARNTRRIMVASAGGSLYYETFLRTLTALSTSLTLASDRLLQSAERGQKLYIADNSDTRAYGTDGVVTGGGVTLDSATYSNWTTLGIDTDDDVVVISNGTGSVVNGTYAITTVASGTLTIANVGGNGNCTFRIQRCPKVYDPLAGTLTKMTATAGQVPTGCPMVCLYRDRIVFAGGDDPHVWYMSRQGDALDWDYSASSDDVQRAVAGESADAGLIGDTLRALIPHSDDYLIFGCESSLWRLRGDPAIGGEIDNLSKTVGVVDKNAWCRGPLGEIVFLSQDGIYALPPGATSYPQSISREKLPRELREIDRNTTTVTMAYDFRDRGVHIYLTPNDSKGRLHFWFDWEDKAFFPVELPNSYEPTAILSYQGPNAENSAVLIGCRDGYVRRYRNEMETDEGTEIESFVLYGPINLGTGNYIEGMLAEIIGVAAANSGSISWSILVGETAEAAVSATPFSSGTWTIGDNSGLNFKQLPRARGAAFILKLENGQAARRWCVESVLGVIRQSGKQLLF
jgi:hypothetical protein